jgi:uncharacterized protein YqfA (UPF0365 family)
MAPHVRSFAPVPAAAMPVKMSVIPKVIETASMAAVAKDGIQLVAVSR